MHQRSVTSQGVLASLQGCKSREAVKLIQKKRFTENKVERKEKGELDASKKQAIH